MNKIYLFTLFFFASLPVFSQNPEWINYTSKGQYVTSISNEKETLWVSTSGGIVKLNKITGKKIFYNITNSGLISNHITDIEVDSSGNKWIAQAQLSRFDGINWTYYPIETRSIVKDKNDNLLMGSGPYLIKFNGLSFDTLYRAPNYEAGFPQDELHVLDIDDLGNIWLYKEFPHTSSLAFGKFDGNTFTYYGSWRVDNLEVDYVTAAKADSGFIWIGTSHGNFIKLSGNDSTTYNFFTNDPVRSITIDENGNKWVTTISRLAKFKGVNPEPDDLTIFTPSNSGLPSNTLTALSTDSFGNIWIGTREGGLSQFTPQKGEWTTHSTSNFLLEDERILSIAIQPNGSKWFGTRKGLAKVQFTSQSTEDWNYFPPSFFNLESLPVNALAYDDSGYIWIASTKCVIKFNGRNYKIYNDQNSPLPSDQFISIATEANGNKWIGTNNAGVIKFDGENWTTYTTINSPLKSNHIEDIAIDAEGNKWFATFDGLAMFDDTNWIVYKHTDSPFPNIIKSIAIDKENNKWIVTTQAEVMRFDGVNWIVYDQNNSPLKYNWLFTSISIDDTDNKWIGVGNGGLIKFDDTAWTFFNRLNSPLPSDEVLTTAVDQHGNKWIGTFEAGLVLFNERGIITGVKEVTSEIVSPDDFFLFQNYPNPFNPVTTINYQIPEESFVKIKVYDVIGREIITLVNEQKSAGSHKINFDAGALSSGFYLYKIEAGNFSAVRKMILMK